MTPLKIILQQKLVKPLQLLIYLFFDKIDQLKLFEYVKFKKFLARESFANL